MMAELAKLAAPQQWDRLQRDGRSLLERGRFGRWSLPPDWLQIGTTDSALSAAPDWPPRFSYDAVRIPLWWVWQKLSFGAAMRSVDQFWSAFPPGAAPAWVDLKTNDVAPYAATPGMAAIMRLTRMANGGAEQTMPPTVADASNYYDAALILLTHIAEREMASN
jgi:endoglucanase